MNQTNETEINNEVTKKSYYEGSDPRAFAPMPSPWNTDGSCMNARKDPRGITEEQKAAFQELKASIEAAKGVRQPIGVISNPDKASNIRYYVVWGHRRWAAVLDLQAEGKVFPLPYVIVHTDSDVETFELMAMENLHRQDLSSMEKASIIRTLLQQGLSSKDIATRLGKSLVWVYSMKSITDERASDEVKDAVTAGHIPQEVAAHIIRRVPKEKQAEALKEALKGLTGSKKNGGEVRRRVQEATGKAPGRPNKRQIEEVVTLLKDNECTGNIPRDDVRVAMVNMLAWCSGTKSTKTLKMTLSRIFNGQLDGASQLFAPKA